MATKWMAAVVAALVSMLTGGCLVYDRTDTFYLEPDGSVIWSVIEKDVRSDAEAPADRAREEAEYFAAVMAQHHELARGLRQLTPIDLRTRVLRTTLPYTVVTEGKFSGLDVLGQRLIARLGLAGSSVLEVTPEGTQWTFTVRESVASHDGGDDDDMAGLARGLDRMQFVLTRGRFAAAQGFELSADGRVARFVEDAAAEARIAEGADFVLSLRWR